MRGVRVAVLTSVLLLSAAQPPADAAPSQRTERQEYFLGELFPDCWLFFGDLRPYVVPGVPANKGGACFDIQPRDLRVNVKIEDDSGLPVSGTYELQSPSGFVLRHDAFCESFTTDISGSAERLIIFVHGPSDGALIYGPSLETCRAQGSVGSATTGTIIARFKMGRPLS